MTMSDMERTSIFDLENIELPGADESAPKPEFTINNDRTAEWALKKIREEKEEYERIKALADKMIAEATYKAEQARKRYEANSAFLTGKLLQYRDGTKESNQDAGNIQAPFRNSCKEICNC